MLTTVSLYAILHFTLISKKIPKAVKVTSKVKVTPTYGINTFIFYKKPVTPSAPKFLKKILELSPS